jgi:hypothetical protein
MRLTTRPLQAAAAAWDPADPEPFKALAGSQFAGTDGDLAVIRTQGGCTMHVHPGWLAFRIDGSDSASFMTPEHVGDGDGAIWSAV